MGEEKPKTSPSPQFSNLVPYLYRSIAPQPFKSKNLRSAELSIATKSAKVA